MKKIAIVLSFISFSIHAGNYNIDARVDAMGGAGTASADHSSAVFYNPALLAFKSNSNISVTFPMLSVQYRDPDNLIGNIDDFKNIYDRYQISSSDQNNKNDAVNTLRNIQDKVSYINGGIGGAISLSSNSLSGSLFIKGYTEAIVLSEISSFDISAIESGSVANLQSKSRVVAFGVLDLGLGLGTQIELYGQKIAIGVTPKLQKLATYHYEMLIDKFNIDDWNDDSNLNDKSVFNFDVGLAWERDFYRIGFVGKNLIPHDITTEFKTRFYTYNLEPLYTLGGALNNELFTLTMDIDLNKQRRFNAVSGPLLNDDTQFIRFGGEFNAWGQAQLRAGYIKDLEDTLKSTFTFGVGLSPFETVHLDLAAQIIDSNSYGGSIKLAFIF